MSGSSGNTGGLVGKNTGTINNSYATGSINGGSFIGGLVGMGWGGNISNSYATGSVSGTSEVGGLVGGNFGTINSSHSTGTVSGTGSGVGGLVGRADSFSTSISNSYSTGNVNGPVARGLVGYGGDAITNSYYDADTVLINGAINFSKYSLGHVQFQDWLNHGMSLGNINIANYGNSLIYDSASGYYLISNVQGMKDLLGFANNATYKFQLTVNIDLAGLIDFYIPSFSGMEFDGANHTISNSNINTQNLFSETGMFGRLSNGSIIKNLGIIGGSITGDVQLGGLVGYNSGGIISNSYFTGNVNGGLTGGLVGYNSGGIIN